RSRAHRHRWRMPDAPSRPPRHCGPCRPAGRPDCAVRRRCSAPPRPAHAGSPTRPRNAPSPSADRPETTGRPRVWPAAPAPAPPAHPPGRPVEPGPEPAGASYEPPARYSSHPPHALEGILVGLVLGEAEVVETGLHLRAQRRLDDQLAPAGAVQLEASAVRLQLQGAGEVAGLVLAGFGVAQDRVAPDRQVGAQLV